MPHCPIAARFSYRLARHPAYRCHEVFVTAVTAEPTWWHDTQSIHYVFEQCLLSLSKAGFPRSDITFLGRVWELAVVAHSAGFYEYGLRLLSCLGRSNHEGCSGNQQCFSSEIVFPLAHCSEAFLSGSDGQPRVTFDSLNDLRFPYAEERVKCTLNADSGR